MKYLKQFCVIIAFTFAGEILHKLIPLPIPGGIYGIILLFAALRLGLVRLDQVKETAELLVSLMSVMFIPAVVGILNIQDLVRQKWPLYLLVLVLTTFIVMAVSGLVTQMVRRKNDHE